MRLPAGGEATIAAALDAGITVFDTARAYGDNEQLVAKALRGSTGARIVTKGGMSRPGGAWIADGRAKTIRADCEASLAALDGVPIDLYLLHAPDPRTPWKTSVRALARLADDGLVANVGLSNVNLPQLDEALELASIAAVQVALSPFDLAAVRGGIVERCEERGLTLIAHSPLGGPRRAKRLADRAEAALAWLLQLSPAIVAIPGATRPETARSAARAASLVLGDSDVEALDREFDRPRVRQTAPREDGEVVVVMGIPGAGKTRLAEEYVARGYLRLNRDERGGSLRELATGLDEALASGERLVVLDNTYLTRASRSYVVESASRHGVAARCVWLETPLAQAQVNLVERIIDHVGALPSPDELRALTREAGLHAPTSQMRTARELEPPSADEGFAAVEPVPFVRAPTEGRAGAFVAAGSRWKDALDDPNAPVLLFDWRPDGAAEDLAAEAARLAAHVSGPVETATCWCRPPLPGLPLAFARAHGVDPARSLVVGTGPAHRTLANTLGARFTGL
jgi:aryl-alcohol dehydrogenase-like predicted oxidoreductase